MKVKALLTALAFLLIALPVAALPTEKISQKPVYHPAYGHALSDLRAAHWYLDHRPGDKAIIVL